MAVTMVEAVELLATKVRDRPELDDEALVEVLVDWGIDRRTAWRLMVFVPMAMSRVVLAEMGVTCADTYIVAPVDPREHHPLAEVEEFVAASTAAAQGRLEGSQISALALRSAEISSLDAIYGTLAVALGPTRGRAGTRGTG
jgi:hypothetical protein